MFETFNSFSELGLTAIAFLIFYPVNVIFAQPPVEYPLHVGDYWEYSANIRKEITKDTTMTNGLNYFKKVSTASWELTSFERQSNDSVSHFYNDQDRLLYDFSLAQGDTATIINGSDTLDIILQWKGTVNIFGKERRQWEFFLDVRHLFDEEEYHWITDSIGMTKWMDFLFSYTLHGAVINGDTLGVITAIPGDASLMHRDFKLYQNYPNPFNTSTQIRFSIPKSGLGSLKIYDVLGKEVATLLSERLGRGEHTYNWDASELPSGIYYCHFVVDDFNEVKKMVLMK
jgi:hypothetical protein